MKNIARELVVVYSLWFERGEVNVEEYLNDPHLLKHVLIVLDYVCGLSAS